MNTAAVRLDESLRAAGIPISGVSSTNGVLTIYFLPEATLEQINTGNALLAAKAWELPTAKLNKMKALDEWYNDTVNQGITVSGITFEATLEAQNRFDALVTMILAAMAVGYASAETPFTAYDKTGNAIALPAGQLIGLMLQYAQTSTVLAGQYSGIKLAINNAISVEQVDAITFPS